MGGKKNQTQKNQLSILIGFDMLHKLLFFFNSGNNEQGEKKPAKIFRIYTILSLTTDSIIWYNVYLWMYMNSIYIIRIMLCYVHIFTILPEG